MVTLRNPGQQEKNRAAPEYPEDTLLESLNALAIPAKLRQEYLCLQLSALPGWASFIKWRAEAREYSWQQIHPASLVDFLTIRLWYERELVQKVCREKLDIGGRYDAIIHYLRARPDEYYLRCQRVAGRLPALYAEEVDRLRYRKGAAWEKLLNHYKAKVVPRQTAAARRSAARKLLGLAKSLDLAPGTLASAAPTQLKQLLDWIESFPESDHGPVWLKALEAGYHE